MSLQELARRNLSVLFSTYAEATGAKMISISMAVTTNPRFGDEIMIKDFRIGTYDTVVKNFSAIWPKSLPWPEGIERPSAEGINLRGPKSFDVHPDWPVGVDWPSDVPRPEAFQPA